MSLPRYPEYKDSGVAWLGRVPSHWQLHQSRRLFEQRRDPSLPDDEQLSATQKYGVIPQRLFMVQEDQKVVLALSGLDNFKHVQPDDFVISLRSFQGGIERSCYEGCVSPAYTVLRPQAGLVAGFWEYLLKSSQYIAALQTATDGIRDGKNISYAQFGALCVPLPSGNEQAAIATFLDRETAKIDTLIAEQEKLLTLLAEKRQATISHAVTKGLNPDAPMKDSGVAWLGAVPAHWLVAPAKRVASVFVPQRNKPDLNVDGDGTYWATMEDVKTNRLSSTKLWVTDAAIKEAGSKKLSSGAIIASCVGNFGVASINDVEVVINQQLQAYIPSPSITAEYLRYLVTISSSYFEQTGTAATLIYVNQQGFENLPTLVPPIQEQMKIIEFLQSEVSRLEALSANAIRAIDLLKERRFALIAAAVTGQIDVRGLVAEPEAA